MNLSDLPENAAEAVELMKSQLLIALVRRLGGSIIMPVTEVDATGPFNLTMSLNPDTRVFTFTVVPKDLNNSPVDHSHGESITPSNKKKPVNLTSHVWLEEQLDKALNKIIWGFYEDEYPVYADNALVQGSVSELHEECGAEEFNRTIKRLKNAEGTLKTIARGNLKCGLPLAGEKARQLSRSTLTSHKVDW